VNQIEKNKKENFSMKRKLGKSEIEVSALGMGCWAIGGPWVYDDTQNEPNQAGWGKVDDDESIRAIHAGLDLGINFFDTAANYGAGHSERILARALAGRREKVVIATKFGYLVNEDSKLIKKDDDAVLGNIRQDCENSLRRLNTGYIDLYQFHVGDFDPQGADAVRDLLEELVREGKIRWYGWSTDNAEGARVFAQGDHCAAIQQALYWATQYDYQPTLKVCEESNLASIIRSPLGMGLLTGKFKDGDVDLPEDDIRHGWDFKKGRIADLVQMVEDLRDVFTSDGRSLAQGALGWLWALSDVTIPIPGFKSVGQVEENAKAMDFGPLKPEQMQKIEEILGRE
jgi:aryl-alcohol dehydrogenase-like predicted oxidoreductase